MTNERAERQNRHRIVIAAAGAAVVLVVNVFLFPSPARAQDGGAGGLRVVGEMPRPEDFRNRPMAVDPLRNLGFVTNRSGGGTVDLIDLERLVRVDDEVDGKFNGSSPETSLAMDTRRERLYAMKGYPGLPEACGVSFAGGIDVFDYRLGRDGRRRLTKDELGPMPCSGSIGFAGLTNSYDPVHDRLYMGGVPTTEAWRPHPEIGNLPSLLGGTLKEDRGSALLVRQLRIPDGPLRSEAGGVLAKAGRFTLEWEVDLRVAGCGRRDQVADGIFEGFVSRVGDDVLAYCWDGRPYQGLQQGQQGYVVRIPLTTWSDGVMRPVTRGQPVFDPVTNQLTNFVYRRTPTLPGPVDVLLDPVSGRALFVTTGPLNGDAVWVFDPKAGRFVGVITGGYAGQTGGTAVGFDSAKGRVYVLTEHGILVAPVRIDPLPAGLVYPVLTLADRGGVAASSDRISVAPALGRLFVAVGNQYRVLEDHIPDPPRVEPVDPDALTTQVKEEEGKVAAATAAQALASGVHVVNTGGAPRAAGQTDPTCHYIPPNLFFANPGHAQPPQPDWEVSPATFGSCLPEAALSGGHREGAAAATELEASTGGGATARGAAVAFGSNDSGTDGDVRRASDCGAGVPDQADRWGRRWPFPEGATVHAPFGLPDGAVLDRNNKKDPGEKRYNEARDAFWDGFSGSEQFQQGHQDYREGCNTLQDRFAEGSAESPTGPVDLRAGTRGPDGKGVGIRAATCGDFGGTPAAETWPEQSAGAPQAGYPTSHVSCDASAPAAEAAASAGALALPSAADPQLKVARVSSRVTSVRTADEGQVTVAYASAAGVTVGPLSIAEVRSLAVTKAAGRKGTTSALLVRQWCGLTVVGPESTETQPGCVDPTSQQAKDLLEEVSAALLQKVQLTVPEGATQATPKGYQAVVTKSVGQRGADQTVNDDDSHTVSALQAVIYNDGPKGRSRLVVQLAGVHAESRYGIIELPNFSTGPDDFEPPPVDGDVGGPVDQPAVDVGTPEGAPAPTPDTFTPETFFEEDFGGAEEFVRFSAPPPRTVTVPGPRGSPVEQIVRVPVRVISDAINLLVQNPREAALLFVMWALLAAPLYLGLRRRSLTRALVGA